MLTEIPQNMSRWRRGLPETRRGRRPASTFFVYYSSSSSSEPHESWAGRNAISEASLGGEFNETTRQGDRRCSSRSIDRGFSHSLTGFSHGFDYLPVEFGG